MSDSEAHFLKDYVCCLGGGLAPHSSILAWRIPMAREACRARVHRVAKTELKGLSTHVCGLDKRSGKE